MLLRPKLECSFCCKSAAQVAKLAAGRRGYICDVCAAEAHRIMSDSSATPAAPTVAPSPSIAARIGRWLDRLWRAAASARLLDRPA